MTYSDFYDIAVYGNGSWKGNFTDKEIAENAFEYFAAFEESKKSNSLEEIIASLVANLTEDVRSCPDSSEEAKEWLAMICEELGITDIDE